jgi:hypothetical protein
MGDNSTQPNKRMNLPTQAVTIRACARLAPDRLAGYAHRETARGDMLVMVNAVSAGSDHAIGWVSLQPDGSTSVGLADCAFIPARFHARQFLWNAYNRVIVQCLVPHSPDGLCPVTNPH